MFEFEFLAHLDEPVVSIFRAWIFHSPKLSWEFSYDYRKHISAFKPTIK